MNVSNTLDPYAGSRPVECSPNGMATPATAATTRLSTTAPVHDCSESEFGIERHGHDADDHSPDRSVQQADQQLFAENAPVLTMLQTLQQIAFGTFLAMGERLEDTMSVEHSRHIVEALLKARFRPNGFIGTHPSVWLTIIGP